MIRIASFNINGIRATLKRGFSEWLSSRQCDVVALQEVRAQMKVLPPEAFAGYYATYNPGELAGRNGVAILTRVEPAAIRSWGDAVVLDPQGLFSDTPVDSTEPYENLSDYEDEGRYIELDLADSPLTVGCLYLPKGATQDEDEPKYLRKMNFMSGFAQYLPEAIETANKKGREFLVVGDFNIAHQNADLKNWRNNQKSEGFLPEERQWVTDTLAATELVDVVRQQYPDQDGPYSWWSWRGRAFENDSGWRIDYHWATEKLASSTVAAVTDREDSYQERRSDHAAVVVDYEF